MKTKIKTIALVAPCGNIKDFCALNEKIKILTENFKIKKYYSENHSGDLCYLSDTDENRINYFENAFCDPEVDLVLNIRGGYGAIRIVDKINYEKIKNTNKIYCASSDGSILLAALSQKTHIKCFHSLMLMNGFVENIDKNLEIIENNLFKLNLISLKKGEAQGKLWGGNLSSIVSMLSGNIYLPEDDIILFLEDLNEPEYKIDKMLYEIYRNNKLKEKIKGIIFGDFYIEPDKIMPLFKNYCDLFNVPCFYSPDITHKTDNIALPYSKFIHLK